MNKETAGKWAIVALACTVLLLFVPNYAQYQLSPISHWIMPVYDLDAAQFSMLFSAAMIPGILLSLVAGLMCDRFGVKRVVSIVGTVSIAALIARIFAPSFGVLFICMVLAGVLATFINANIAKIMGSWFAPEKVGLAVGIGLAGSTCAMVVGLGTSALFPSLQTIFVFTAALGVVALVAWWFLFKDGPRSMQVDSQSEADSVPAQGDIPTADRALAVGDTPASDSAPAPGGTPASDSAPASDGASADSGTTTGDAPAQEGTPAAQPTLSECLKVVLKSRNVWLVGVGLGLDMAATMCILTFLPQVLQATRGFDPAAAGALSSVVTFGNLSGSVLTPLINTRLGRFKSVAIVFAIIAGVGTAFAWQLPDGPIMMICFFLTGFTLSGLMTMLVSAIVLLPEIGPVYAGTAGGVCSTLQLFGAVVIPSYILAPILGTNYAMLYGIGGFLCLIAAVCVFMLPEVLGRLDGKPNKNESKSS